MSLTGDLFNLPLRQSRILAENNFSHKAVPAGFLIYIISLAYLQMLSYSGSNILLSVNSRPKSLEC